MTDYCDQRPGLLWLTSGELFNGSEGQYSAGWSGAEVLWWYWLVLTSCIGDEFIDWSDNWRNYYCGYCGPDDYSRRAKENPVLILTKAHDPLMTRWLMIRQAVTDNDDQWLVVMTSVKKPRYCWRKMMTITSDSIPWPSVKARLTDMEELCDCCWPHYRWSVLSIFDLAVTVMLTGDIRRLWCECYCVLYYQLKSPIGSIDGSIAYVVNGGNVWFGNRYACCDIAAV